MTASFLPAHLAIYRSAFVIHRVKMASTQTIKLGNISVTVSVETATPQTRVEGLAPAPTAEPVSNEELLFNRVAERLKFSLKQTILVNPSFKHYLSVHLKGSNTGLVEDMERYMSHYPRTFAEGAYGVQARRALFRSAMKKNGLSFEEDIFQAYLDHTKTTERKPKENRYRRMDSFIKSLQ
jgi:hypothetical protein